VVVEVSCLLNNVAATFIFFLGWNRFSFWVVSQRACFSAEKEKTGFTIGKDVGVDSLQIYLA
jgi:hypothetical protein